ncbi:hypothetical protein HQ533_02050 [Candidatus Woesearchaeota archaeon]|nr:hypothetical protein [Candidatus Woesearchaeota archaeon]
MIDGTINKWIKKTIFLMWILIIPFVYSSGSVWTGSLNPSDSDICGAYQNSTTITATNILNTEDETLVNLTATLIIAENAGLIITEEEVFLGNLINKSVSSNNPNWDVACDNATPGNYTLYINYASANGYTGTSENEAETTIEVHPEPTDTDTTPPNITAHSPISKILSTTTEISVETDEDSTCRYSTTVGVSYENMQEQLTTVDKRTHKKLLSQLSDGVKTYYIRCKDTAGNTLTEDYELLFEVDASPTAEVQVEKESPLKEGKYEVTLTTSEDVEFSPSLQYKFEGETTKKEIALEGSGSEWKGILKVDSDDNDKTGTFYFSGIDLIGNSGTAITKGQTFFVDTEAPPIPTILGESDKTTVTLTFIYNDEDFDNFKVYRSEDESLIKAWMIKKTSSKTYSDRNLIEGITYYYAVSAVDEAGNEGPISNIVTITIQKTAYTQEQEEILSQEEILEEEEKTISPEDVKKIDNTKNSIAEKEEEILDAKKIIDSYQGFEKELAVMLNLDSVIAENLNQLSSLEKNLERLKTNTNEELDEEIRKIDIKSKAIVKSTPVKIEVENTISTNQITMDEDVNDIIIKIQDWLRLSDKQVNKYTKESKKLQNRIGIKITAKIIKLSYLGGSEETSLFVEKEIINKEGADMSNTKIVEYIPKEVAENTKQIIIRSANYEVIREDPIIEWKYTDIDSRKIKYLVKNNPLIASSKETKTFVLPDVDLDSGFSGVTGFSIFGEGSGLNILSLIVGLFIIAGLAGYYVFAAKKTKQLEYETVHYKKKAEQPDLNWEARSVQAKEQPIEDLVDESSVIKSLIRQTDTSINNNNFELARKLYTQILLAYNDPNLPSGEKMKYYYRIIKIHNKLTLYNYILRAKFYAKKEDITGLKETLEKINEQYEKVSASELEQIPLVEHAKETLSYYNNALNGFHKSL